MEHGDPHLDPLVIEAAQLLGPLDKCNAKDVSFVSDLVNHFHKKKLTPNRAYWLKRMAAKYFPEFKAKWDLSLFKNAPAPETVPSHAAPEIIELPGVYKLLKTAKANGLKNPKIKISLLDKHGDPSSPFVLALTGAKSSKPEHIVLTNGKGWDEPGKEFYGWITPTGEWIGANKISDAEKKSNVKAALIAIASNPAAVAFTHGKLTGHCCFCSKPLDTKESVGAGYGPICAGKYGLPWGSSTAAKYVEKKESLLNDLIDAGKYGSPEKPLAKVAADIKAMQDQLMMTPAQSAAAKEKLAALNDVYAKQMAKFDKTQEGLAHEPVAKHDKWQKKDLAQMEPLVPEEKKPLPQVNIDPAPAPAPRKKTDYLF